MLKAHCLVACILGLIDPVINAGRAAEVYRENPTKEGNGNFTIGPDYKIDPDLTDKGNPKGRYFEFSMRLADSRIFRGDDSTLEPEKKAVREERKIFVYIPAAYKDGTEAPILVTHDGPSRLDLVRNALDNLTMGWFRPDLFRRLITYSGTFVDQQDDDAPEEAKYPLGAWEYHSSMKLIENSEKKPLRICTHVSENDNRAKDPEETYHNWVMANERTAAALKAKGYDYRYVYSRATRHCDRRVFEQTLADTLVWMWQGYPHD